jgi:hypothetical protein
MLKDSWVHELNRLSMADSFHEDSIPLNNELNAYLRNSIITGEMKNILDDFGSYDFSKHKGPNIQYRAQGEIMWINYEHPTITDYRHFDAKWFCPIMFQHISLDNLIKILFGIMLEKSLVFVSRDIQYCS